MSYILAATGLQREAKLIARTGLVAVACGGHGAVLEAALEARIAARRPAKLWSIGIAGALDPALRVGDVVSAGVVGVELAATSVAAKAALRAATGAAAVDMESHVAARVAARHGLRFGVLRAISDTAGRDLPPAACVPLNPDGSVNLPAVLAALARQPSQLPDLLRLARDTSRALRELLRRLDSLAGDGLLGLDLGELGLDVL